MTLARHSRAHTLDELPVRTYNLLPPSDRVCRSLCIQQQKYEDLTNSSDKMRIKQIFFDCDNTLVDTERAAVECCATVINKVLQDQGLERRYTVEQLLELYWGKTARQMIVELQKEFHFQLSAEQTRQYIRFEEDQVIKLICAQPSPCHGVKKILKRLSAERKYQLAVVSSSPIRRIRAALEAADIAQYFDPSHVYSAKNSMPTPKSKPNPAIYQWAMAENGVTPEQCIAFEDSRSGARSAINAGIATIAYVGAYPTPDQRDEIARSLMAEGCKMVMLEYDSFFNCLEYAVKEIQSKDRGQKALEV